VRFNGSALLSTILLAVGTATAFAEGGQIRLSYKETKIVTNCDGSKKIEKGVERHALLWDRSDDGKVVITLAKGGSAPEPILKGDVTGSFVSASGTRTLNVFGRESSTTFELHGRLDKTGKLKDGTLRTFKPKDPTCWFETSFKVQ
jgi:hypothetical protein